MRRRKTSKKKKPPPEGPECAVVADWLRTQLTGQAITAHRVISGRYARHGSPLYQDRINSQVTGVVSHGKLIGIHFAYGWTLASTLGMTGNWSYEAGKHARVSFSLTNGLVLHFTDVRNFGTLKVQTTVDFVARRAALGPDVLKSPVAAVSGRIYDFRYAFQQDGRSVTLVEALMDQRILAGVGNYLKSEILFAAKLSPHRQLSSLTDDEIAALATEIVRIPQESYRLGGTTLRNYHAPDGEPGRFSEILKVYGKNGHGIKKETTADKRTTFWVPSVQV